MNDLQTQFRFVTERLSLLFGSAGGLDRLWTKARASFADHQTRNRLVDEFHARWEKRLLTELEQGSSELMQEGAFGDVSERRRKDIQPKLDHVRSNKEALLKLKY
jgi:hypothetical protein